MSSRCCEIFRNEDEGKADKREDEGHAADILLLLAKGTDSPKPHVSDQNQLTRCQNRNRQDRNISAHARMRTITSEDWRLHTQPRGARSLQRTSSKKFTLSD